MPQASIRQTRPLSAFTADQRRALNRARAVLARFGWDLFIDAADFGEVAAVAPRGDDVEWDIVRATAQGAEAVTLTHFAAGDSRGQSQTVASIVEALGVVLASVRQRGRIRYVPGAAQRKAALGLLAI